MPDKSLADIGKLYRDRFPEQERIAKRRIWKVLCEEYLSRYVRTTDTALDIACGYGEFINFIACGKRIAYDINPDAAAYLRPDVQFHNLPCSELDDIDDESVDVAFESNLFEHLPNKTELHTVVEQVYRKLRPGGRFIVLQPNILYVGNAYWNFYDHIIPLTHISCGELLENCRFQIERSIPRFIPYTTKTRLPQHPIFVSMYLKFPAIWSVMGKQFLIVARK